MRKFFLTLFYHEARQMLRVDGRIADAVNQVGDAANVVEVAVRYKNAENPIFVFLQISCVREHVVDAGHDVFRYKLKSCVENHNAFLKLYERHIASDFLNSPDRDDTHRISIERRQDYPVCLVSLYYFSWWWSRRAHAAHAISVMRGSP